jgi:hypothetical protein
MQGPARTGLDVEFLNQQMDLAEVLAVAGVCSVRYDVKIVSEQLRLQPDRPEKRVTELGRACP